MSNNSTGRSDPLLLCLSFLMAFHGRSKSPDALIAGLPYTKEGFSPELFVEAASRVRLKASLINGRPLAEIAGAVLPVVLLLTNRQACVLLEIEGQNVKIWDPSTGSEKLLSLTELARDYSEQALFVKPKSSFIDPVLAYEEGGTRHWFWQAVLENRKIYRKVLLASFLINIFALVSPVYIMNVYDRVIPNSAIETGWALAIGAMIVFVVDLIIRTLRGYFIDFAGRNIDVRLARGLFDQILDMKLMARPSSSGAYASMLREFDSVREFLTSATLVTLIDLPFAVLFLVMIFVFGGSVGLAVLSLMALSVLAAFLIQVPLKKHIERALRSSETKHGLLVETIYGLETIKSMSADGRVRARYAAHVAENASSSLKSRHYSALSVNVATFIQQAASVFIVLIGMYLVRDGALSMGALIACVILSGRALSPITQVANLLSRYHQTLGSLRTLSKIMASPRERPEGKDFLYRPDLSGDIRFDRVSFSYPQTDRKVLDEVSFSIRPGEKVGIIGRIGSGKSTIARLLLKLYEPKSGSILIDGTDYLQIDPADLRRKIAYVAQDVTLFQGTIRDNLTASVPHASEEEILRCSKLSGAHSFISAHPLGYDAPVGERGDGLSGGQKQCIALARAFLMKPKVLVCDEPTNAMDMQTEEHFARVIRSEIEDQGLILVTHRASLLSLVDRLILIEGGRVLMDDTRDKVLSALSSGKFEVPK